MLNLRHLLATTLCAMLGLAQAQDIPKKTLTLVVGFARGRRHGDAAARIIARKLQENLGLSVVVDNRAGAGGNTSPTSTWPGAGKPTGSVILLGSVGPWRSRLT